ncbi:MAG: DEAD/DEAH box helicase [Prevotella sp.]|nr:DEAD/DEAH box helicase [Prevotella sp.]
MRFDELYLNDNILDALDDMHFETCTPIQEACIPEILDGRDLIGVAQTGTGKTAAYLLPILSLIDDGYYPEDAINCVVMSPTRELAQQIDQAMEGFGYYLEGISSVPVYGGNDGGRYDQETKGLQLGANVVIATPGRLISHIMMQHADLSRVSFFVLDEADRMLDMGFSDDILKIASYLPKTCQTIMFSATMPQKIEQLAKTLLKNPVEVKLAVSRPADNIMQAAYVCHENQKLGIIRHLFKNNELSRVIIFAGSKLKVKEINRSLRQMHINSGEMHSDLDQSQRDEMMYRFKSGQVDVLVATDIVARGIDIDDIATVMNYDVPHDSEDYVHRIGRTARAQRDGKAITLVRGREIADFMQIEKFLGYAVEKLPLPEGLGEAPEYKPMGRGGHGGSFRGKGRGHRRRGHSDRGKSKGTSAETRPETEAKQKRHHRRKSKKPEA